MKSLNNLMALFLMLIFLVIFGCAHKTPFNFKLPPKEQIPDEISKEVRHSIIGLYNYEPANSFQLNCEIAATELRNMGKKAKEAVPYFLNSTHKCNTTKWLKMRVNCGIIIRILKPPSERSAYGSIHTVNSRTKIPNLRIYKSTFFKNKHCL